MLKMEQSEKLKSMISSSFQQPCPGQLGRPGQAGQSPVFHHAIMEARESRLVPGAANYLKPGLSSRVNIALTFLVKMISW